MTAPTNVRAHTSLPERLREDWDTAAVASANALSTGTAVDRVALAGPDSKPLIDLAVTLNQSQC